MGRVRSVVIDEFILDYRWDGTKTIEIVVAAEIENWCNENTTGWVVRYVPSKAYDDGRGTYYDAKGYIKVIPQHKIVFKTVNDAVKFKLRWQ